MTSVVDGGLFNAVDFAGAGFLFSKLNGQGYKEEVKRHNQALEKLAKAKEKFYESEVKRRNDEARRRAEILDANKDIEQTNRALEDLRDFRRLMDDSASQRKPKLEDYYQPEDVNEENKDEAWTRIYGYPLDNFPKPKFKVGDHVRVEIKYKAFEKGNEPIFDSELYVITAVFRGDPNMYSLRDPEDGEDILGIYYKQNSRDSACGQKKTCGR
ncbi:Hypothetical predicted protein [Paramuricea clavata]|uniref:Uncharacterized protein n=1 Tax=Paramuricea clavata TaxID=317549 RepID=A0A6S7GL20_PARCT|nr:Hypothetical predicted protein [Paramuricea clavata]